MGRITCRRRGETGMSLAEIVVAAALALIGFLVALILYQAARDLFKRGEQASDQQQAVRLGFDQMVRDLRLAGFNYNPDGVKTRVDEQIEGAWANAVVVRADYDGEDTSGLAADPESYINGVFNMTSTGNDEVVGYVLRSPSGTGGTSLTFKADVNSSTTATSPAYGTVATRDNAVETVTIGNVAVTQTGPPYTLYKMTLSNSATAWGTAGFVQFTPVADNIKSLTFTYYDANGNQVAAPGGDDTATAVNSRASIRRINISLVGMTAIADTKYVDPTDALAASKNYRKFSLAADVTPRNLGKVGVPDIDLSPPSTPTGVATCAGHCNGMVLKWTANPVADAVSQYTVRYGTSSGVLNTQQATFTNSIWISGLLATTYYFQVRAEDSSGNASPWTSEISALVRDDVSPTLTTPNGVGSSTASGGGTAVANKVNLSWPAVTTNVETISCDPGVATLCRDLSGYRIYKGTTGGSPPPCPGGSPVVDETTQKTTAYSDTSVVNCRNYYYCLNAADLCSHVSANQPNAIQGNASTPTAPAAPTGVTASRTGSTTVVVNWNAVTQDASSSPVFIDTYEVWRSIVPTDGADPNSSTYHLIATVGPPTYPAIPATTYTDTSAPSSGLLTPYYKIKAKDDCPNTSAFSTPPAGAPCLFNGTITISPPTGSSLALPGAQTITVTYSGPDTIVSCQLVITKSTGGIDFNQTQAGAGPVFTFTWTPSTTGSFTALATVTNSPALCAGTATSAYTVTPPPPPCCLSVNTASTTYPGSGNSRNQMDFVLTNTGSCSSSVNITQMVVQLNFDQDSCDGLPKLSKIESPAGTTRFDGSSSPLALPATAPFSTALTVNNSSSATIRVIFSGNIQDKCNGTGGNITRRDRIASNFTFTQVSTGIQGTCSTIILNTGAPTP